MINDRHINTKEKCEILGHITRKVSEMSNIPDMNTESRIYDDLLSMALREAGAYSIDYVESRFLYCIHDAIDCYQFPQHLREKIEKGGAKCAIAK